MSLKLGKRPATHDDRDLLFAAYAVAAKLPRAPKGSFGHDAAIAPLGESWGMLGNDSYGDCVWAGAAHETMVWNAEQGRRVSFSDDAVLGDYSAATGFRPDDPSTDQGTDVREAMGYRRSTGVADGRHQRHKIAAYVRLDPGNHTELWQALYLFGVVGIGFEFPDYAMDEFRQNRRWSYHRKGQIEGGHYVPVVARKGATEPVVVTWGREQEMTLGFYEHYCDEAWVPLSEEALSGGRSLEGFDLAALQADLRALSA
jgi:hypothetical protein